VGGLLGAHRLRIGGSRKAAFHDFFLGGLGTAGTQWFFCRREEHDKRLALRAYYETQAALQSGKQKKAPSGGAQSGGVESPAVESPAAQRGPIVTAVPQWKKDLEAIVTYDLPTVRPNPGGHPRGEGFTIS
jgi:hypothetical protein